MNDLRFLFWMSSMPERSMRREEKIGGQTAICGPRAAIYLSKTSNTVPLNYLWNLIDIFTTVKNNKPLSGVKKTDIGFAIKRFKNHSRSI